MLTEGIDIVITVVAVFSTQSRIAKLLALAWGKNFVLLVGQ